MIDQRFRLTFTKEMRMLEEAGNQFLLSNRTKRFDYDLSRLEQNIVVERVRKRLFIYSVQKT